MLLAGALCSGYYLLARNHRDEVRLERAPGVKFGDPRRSVKRAIDPGATAILRVPTQTTLRAIDNLPRPGQLPSDIRLAPFETTIWRFRAKLTEVTVSEDNDFYIIVESDGIRSCIEIPDPANCEGSPFLSEIRAARQDIAARYQPGYLNTPIDREAEVTGVGFYGTVTALKGMKAPNRARLFPVLKIDWK